MSTCLGDIIRFRDDKLFQGAVDISWFYRDRDKAEAAAAAFVFHGPRYHGVRQKEGYHEHRLTDTATLACSILSQSCGKGEQPFKMAVAGYGTGKSHLALALAEFLHTPESTAGQAVLESIVSADEELGQECRILLNEQGKPSLVIPLNGMREFPLLPEILRCVTASLHADGHDSTPVENMRPRFAKAASLIERLHQQFTDTICQEAGKPDLESLVAALREEQDEAVYKAVAQYLEKEGIPFDAGQNGSLPEFFQILVESYCGIGKPYKSVVILFDEFGKYLEFAIGKPYIAGTNALQELFEAVQGCSQSVCFVGFIQFELKAYLQRLNAEYRNEAQRYITRYDNAEKVYLSTNLETLIAHLIEKTDRAFIEQHIAAVAESTTGPTQFYLRHFFPASQNSAVWQDQTLFSRVICRGCWPLSPFALWFIYSLAAESRFLQGRSALSLLKELFVSLADKPADSLPRGGIPASSLLTPSLREELISSEKSGNQGAIAYALESVLNRHGNRLSEASIAILKAIVIAAKLVMKADNRDNAIEGLGWLCGLTSDVVQKELDNLQFESNLIEWDESLCCFDILSDAIPKTQFINFLHQRRLNEYDDHKQAGLFIKVIDKLTNKLTPDIETDFGELHNIKTREWRFAPQKTHINFISPVLNDILTTWPQRTGHDEAKGTLLFCYAGHEIALEDAMSQLRKELRTALRQHDLQNAPVFIILLHDADNQLGILLAEYDILQNLNKAEKEKFANLVSSHEESLRKHAEKIVHQLIKQRNWIAPLQEELPQRLPSVGRALFEYIYKETLPFSMDGFATAHGNGPATAREFAYSLFHNRLIYDDVQALPSMKKNRAVALFKNDWNIFSKTPRGEVLRNPAPLQRIFRRWDTACREGLAVSDMYAALLRPPIGMNDISALLLISVYLAARHSSLYVHDGENTLSVREWAVMVSPEKKKKITPQIFGAARLFLAEENTSQWPELLDEWNACTSYKELREFPDRATALKKQYPITQVEDAELYHILQQKSEHARKELQDFENLENKAEEQCALAETKGNISLYLYSIANFGKLLSKIEAAPECWPQEYASKFEQRFGKMRQDFATVFPRWLETLAPATDTIDAIATFKEQMEKFKGKLLAIHLENEADKLKEYMQNACKNAEILGKYRAEIRSTESWLEESKTTFSTQSIDSLRQARDMAKAHAKNLTCIARNKTFEGLPELREQLSEHQKTLERHLGNLERRTRELLNPSFESMEDIQNHQAELTRLEQFCSRQDAQDVADLKYVLDWLISSWKGLRNDGSLDAAMLAARLAHLSTELAAQIEEKELGLDAAALHALTVMDIEKTRRERSTLWLADAHSKCERCAGLSTEQATALYTWLHTEPAYLTDQDRAVLEQLRNQLHAHLARQKMDWLLQEFSKLSREQQKILLDRLRLLVSG